MIKLNFLQLRILFMLWTITISYSSCKPPKLPSPLTGEVGTTRNRGAGGGEQKTLFLTRRVGFFSATE